MPGDWEQDGWCRTSARRFGEEGESEVVSGAVTAQLERSSTAGAKEQGTQATQAPEEAGRRRRRRGEEQGEGKSPRLTVNSLARALDPAVARREDRLDLLELVGVAGDEDWRQRAPGAAEVCGEWERTEGLRHGFGGWCGCELEVAEISVSSIGESAGSAG